MARLYANSGKRGFTLIEIMMAVMVLVLVMMSSVGAMTIGLKMLEDARLSTLASQVLQSEMENLRLKNWSQLCDPAVTVQSGTFTVDTDLSSAAFNKFTCRQNIVDVKTGFKKITLSVTWTNSSGTLRTRVYVTNIAQNGINDYYYRRF